MKNHFLSMFKAKMHIAYRSRPKKFLRTVSNFALNCFRHSKKIGSNFLLGCDEHALNSAYICFWLKFINLHPNKTGFRAAASAKLRARFRRKLNCTIREQIFSLSIGVWETNKQVCEKELSGRPSNRSLGDIPYLLDIPLSLATPTPGTSAHAPGL